MNPRPAILCPIDFSEHSRGALRYGAAIAAHFGARLTLLTVNHPAAEVAPEFVAQPYLVAAATERQLELFFQETVAHVPHGAADMRAQVREGVAAREIVRGSQGCGCDLIVMCSHGSTSIRKVFFGSTTEQVLRETTVPVLVTPCGDSGPDQLEALPGIVKRVLAPVDFTAATAHQLDIARGLAEAIAVPILLLHVIEPADPSNGEEAVSAIRSERRYLAERKLAEALDTMPAELRPEALIAYGAPADEIAKVAREHEAGVIVMGLHSSPLVGPRMGTVTYRVLNLARRLVLALPPLPVAIHPFSARAREIQTV